VDFCDFNIAPMDVGYKNTDYSGGCWAREMCGMGLNRYGYYCCSVAGGIDRVLGLNIGRKKLPSSKDLMNDQSSKFCRYCGHLGTPPWPQQLEQIKIRRANSPKGRMSESWVKAYKKYKRKKPLLTLY